MKNPLAFGRILLLSTALMSPAALLAQAAAPAPADQPADRSSADQGEEQVEISTLGAPAARDIVVTGRRQQNVVRATLPGES